jgi:hypothetical protein
MATGPEAETTVVEAIAELRRAGYSAEFSARGDGLRCTSCGNTHPASEAQMDRVVRIEGVTDPADEAIVFGLTCAHCGTRGVFVAAYGPAATEEEAAVITALTDARG